MPRAEEAIDCFNKLAGKTYLGHRGSFADNLREQTYWKSGREPYPDLLLSTPPLTPQGKQNIKPIIERFVETL
jgi:hypothetical protein